jgi:hypothetical protein
MPQLPSRGLPGQQQGSSGGLIASLLGIVDSRGPMGQAARGTNVYQGTSNAPRVGTRAQIGGFDATQQALANEAITRRLQRVRKAVKPTQQLQGGF